ncbi:hypothetical protein ACFS7Z_14775 [Pontibacter toksunensis]|uniref:PAS domain-containing protein n=1 Tax=Pontibacter toksunensis TaxID=1332631 RepID=A0ABW6BX17_9BACT
MGTSEKTPARFGLDSQKPIQLTPCLLIFSLWATIPCLHKSDSTTQQAEQSRQQLHGILMQAPAMICIFEGPQHVFKLVNPPYQRLEGERPLLGRPIAEAIPEQPG